MIDHPCVFPGKSWECGSEIRVLRDSLGLGLHCRARIIFNRQVGRAESIALPVPKEGLVCPVNVDNHLKV